MRRYLMPLEQSLYRRAQVGVAKVAHGQIDCYLHLESDRCPRRALAERRIEHPLGERNDQAGVFREWDEPVWWNHALRGMRPADQCFHATQFSGAEGHLRLVVHRQCTTLQAGAEVRGKPHLFDVVAVERGVIPCNVQLLPFGYVHRHVGALQQNRWGVSVPRRDRDTGTHAHGNGLALNDEWGVERRHDFLCNPHRRLFPCFGQQHRELVTTQAGHRRGRRRLDE